MAAMTRCPQCAASLQVPEEALERQVRCPKCQGVFRPRDHVAASAPLSTAIAPARPSMPDTASEPTAPPLRSPVEDFDTDRLRRGPHEGELSPPRGQGLALAARILILLVIVSDFCLLAMHLWCIVDEDRAGGLLDGLDDRVVAVLLGFFAKLALAVPSVIVFLTWFAFAYGNLRRFGVQGQSHGTGWAVGYFFIPFLNLVRPYQIAQEIWRGSDPEADPHEDPQAWKSRSGSGLILTWWLLWLLASILTDVEIRFLDDSNLADDAIRVALHIGAAAYAVSILAGTTLIFVIGAIVHRQEEKWRVVEEGAESRS